MDTKIAKTKAKEKIVDLAAFAKASGRELRNSGIEAYKKGYEEAVRNSRDPEYMIRLADRLLDEFFRGKLPTD